MKKAISATMILLFLATTIGHSQGTWKEYRDEVNTGLIRGGNLMSFFTEAKDGSIWVSNTTGSLVRIREDQITIFDDLKRSIASQTNIGVIVEARERTIGVWWESAADMVTGWVWFVSNRGIVLWDGQVLMQATDETDEQSRMIFFAESNGKNYIIDGNETVELPATSVKVRNPLINMYTVAVDKSGRAWFGGFKGRLYSIKEGVWTEYKDIQEFSGAGINDRSKSISKIFEDSQGQIWFVSSEFISRYTQGEFIIENSLPGLTGAIDITEDRDGNFWIATGTGVYWYDGENWTYFGKEEGIEKIQYAGSIKADGKGNIWFLTTTNDMYTKPGFVYKYDGSSWAKYELGKKSLLTSMYIDNKDRVWVSDSRGIYVYENEEWKLMRDCTAMFSFHSIYQDSQNRIWIGRGSFTGQIDMYTE